MGEAAPGSSRSAVPQRPGRARRGAPAVTGRLRSRHSKQRTAQPDSVRLESRCNAVEPRPNMGPDVGRRPSGHRSWSGSGDEAVEPTWRAEPPRESPRPARNPSSVGAMCRASGWSSGEVLASLADSAFKNSKYFIKIKQFSKHMRRAGFHVWRSSRGRSGRRWAWIGSGRRPRQARAWAAAIAA